MGKLFDLPVLPKTKWRLSIWKESKIHSAASHGYTADQMQAYAREAQTDLIGRLAQMQEHEAIELLLKARQDWWKS